MFGLGIGRLGAGAYQAVGAAPPAPWTPAEISTALWLDAADASTIILNGSNVSQWSDKSGNNRHATQAVASNQPNYVASDSLMNGSSTIGINSSNGSVGLDTPSITAKNAYVVVYYGTGADSTFLGFTTLFSGPGEFGAFRVAGDNGTANFNSGFGFPFNNQTFKNGSTTNSSTVLPMPASVLKLKSNTDRTQVFSLGYNKAVSGRTWQGFYSEFIFTAGTEDLATEQKIEGYLAHKWGLTANLPSDHPYKTEAPTV